MLFVALVPSQRLLFPHRLPSPHLISSLNCKLQESRSCVLFTVKCIAPGAEYQEVYRWYLASVDWMEVEGRRERDEWMEPTNLQYHPLCARHRSPWTQAHRADQSPLALAPRTVDAGDSTELPTVIGALRERAKSQVSVQRRDLT